MFTPRRRSPDSFYESFSDLIFGTMAIFILLFILMLALIRPLPPEEEPEEPKAVELVVAIDISGSMTEPYAELREALLDLGQNFPRLIEDFSVGIVAYRSNLPGSAEVFEIRRMDAGTMSELEAFLARVGPSGGAVDPSQALERAIGMLNRTPPRENLIRSLVLIGDVGPYEDQVGSSVQLDYTSDRARSREDGGVQAVRSFASSAPDHQVLAVFTYAPDRADNPETPYSQNYFCRVAQSAGPQGRFTRSRGQLMWQLLETFLPKEDEEAAAPEC